MNEKYGNVYFIFDGVKVRIGKAKNLSSRLRSHLSSNCDFELIASYQMPLGLMDKEERYCHNYFKKYKIIRDHSESFYDKEIIPLINDLINFRNYKIVKNQINLEKRTKSTIFTLDGEKRVTDLLSRCVITGAAAGRISNPNLKTNNMNERSYWSCDRDDPFNKDKWIKNPVSELGKRILQDITRTIKIRLALGEIKNEYVDMLIDEERKKPTLEAFFDSFE